MKEVRKKLTLEQLDQKLKQLSVLKDYDMPEGGWIYTVRKALNMSLAQYGRKIGKTLVTVREFELREANNQIRLGTLIEAAEALDCKLVYTLIPKDGSLDKMVEKRAQIVAKKMLAKDPAIKKIKGKEKKEKAIKKMMGEKTGQLKKELPKDLWD